MVGNEGIMLVAMLSSYQELQAQAPEGTTGWIDSRKFVFQKRFGTCVLFVKAKANRKGGVKGRMNGRLRRWRKKVVLVGEQRKSIQSAFQRVLQLPHSTTRHVF